jgi:hypothetical protein
MSQQTKPPAIPLSDETTLSDVKQLGLWAAIASLSYVFWVVGGMEMVERLAFYGVRAVATIYATRPLSTGGLGVTMATFGWLPEGLERQWPKAGEAWEWQWFWPSRELMNDPQSGLRRRHHVLDQTFQHFVRQGARQAKLNKKVTPGLLVGPIKCDANEKGDLAEQHRNESAMQETPNRQRDHHRQTSPRYPGTALEFTSPVVKHGTSYNQYEGE